MKREEVGEAPRKDERPATVVAALIGIGLVVVLILLYAVVFWWALAALVVMLALWGFSSETGQLVCAMVGAVGTGITLPISIFLVVLDAPNLLMNFAVIGLLSSFGLFGFAVAGSPKH